MKDNLIEKDSEKKSQYTKFFTTKTLVTLAMLSAWVILLQGLAFIVPTIGGVSVTFTLIPIVIGGVYFASGKFKWSGILVGGYLGLLFGVLACFDALTGGMTTFLFVKQPLLTIITCLTKGIFTGIIPAFIYILLQKKHVSSAIFLAAFSAPIVNTGIFICFMYLMMHTVQEFMATNSVGENLPYFLFITCAGINFIVESIINVVLSPTILFIQKYISHKK